MNLIFAICVGCAVILLASFRWRWSVMIALLLVIFEGAIRKWLLPGMSELVYFGKDFVLIGAYVGFFFFERHKKINDGFPGFPVILAAAALIVVAQGFNTNINSMFLGALGVKNYLAYVPLCLMVNSFFPTPPNLQRGVERYFLLTIPVCLLGVAQFEASAESPLNTYAKMSNDQASEGADIALFGNADRVRITGTFSYIAGHSTFLLVGGILILGLLANSNSQLWLWLYFVQLGLVVANILMTGSRLPLLGLILAVAAFGLSSLGEKQNLIGRLIVTGVVIGASAMFFFGDALAVFQGRVVSAEDTESRFTDVFSSPLEVMDAAGLGGFGAGVTHPSTAAVRRVFGLPGLMENPPLVEVEPARVLLEIGILGFILWYALRLYVAWALWKTWRSLSNPALRHFALAALLIHLIHLPISMVINHTYNVYNWFLAGFIFLLPRLDAELRQQAAAAVEEPEAVPRAPARWGVRRR